LTTRLDIEAETIVVGGGIVGLCTAWFLAAEGAEVALIDDGADAGTTSNAGSLHVQIQSRLIRRFPHLLPGVLDALPLYPLAVRHWQRLAQLLPVDIDLRLTGGLMVAEDAEQLAFLRQKAEQEAALGLEVEILDRRALDRIAPYLGPEVIGAERCAIEGKVDPLAANAAIVNAAAAAGVALWTGARVGRIEPAPKGYRLVTARGSAACRRLVVAAGAGTGPLLAPLGIDVPSLAEPLHMNVTEPAGPVIGHLLQHAERMITIKQLATGQLVIGGGWPARPGIDGHPAAVARASLVGNLALACAIVPEVAGLKLLRSWAGINTTTDGRSVLGPAPGHPGLFLALPGDAGYTLGPLLARLVTDQMQGRSPEVPLEPYAASRFAGRPAHRTPIGV